MSQQLQNLHHLGPVVVAQKVLGGGCGGGGGGGGGDKSAVPWMPKKTNSLQT